MVVVASQCLDAGMNAETTQSVSENIDCEHSHSNDQVRCLKAVKHPHNIYFTCAPLTTRTHTRCSSCKERVQGVVCGSNTGSTWVCLIFDWLSRL